MESDHLNSFRLGSSSAGRNNGLGVFSRSSDKEEDDEDALKWAAIEKLPIFKRLQRGLLKTPNGGSIEIDVSNLGLKERQVLLERLIEDGEEGNERFLRKLRTRMDRVGIKLPTIEVRFEHLNVEAEACAGGSSLPTFLNFSTNILEGFLRDLHILSRSEKRFSILNNVSGIIKPSRLTLLLGPPSSGKTTLLKALAGHCSHDLQFSGEISYNGHRMDEFVPQRTAAYISQHDVHLAQMTVRETLAFSARCQGVGYQRGRTLIKLPIQNQLKFTLYLLLLTEYLPYEEMLSELSRREKEANIKPDPDIDVFMKALAIEGQETNVAADYILKILGLEVCADTIVGNQMIRGISGGQRKRLTTGEMLVGPAKALFMDEISTGLDSSTTFQILNFLKQAIHIINATAVISLLQPAPETYNLFDDVILLSDGQIVYQGPRENVLEFFVKMGFKCPERKGVADFLQEVTSRKDQEQYWAHKDQPYRFITVEEFAEAFQSFHVGHSIRDELAIPFDKSRSHPAALSTKKYGVAKKELFQACLSREFLLVKRNSFVYIFKLFHLMVMATITMTLFLRTNMHGNSVNDGGIYLGALFYALTSIMFNGAAEISLTLTRLPVFHKQRDLFFFPPWAYALPPWILKIPLTFVDVGLWVFITYYVIGFDPDVQRLFRQYLVLVLVNQMTSALFRFTAAAARHVIVANTFGSFALLTVFALGGVVLSRDEIKKWWLWGYWISPMMYAQNALVANEFLGKSWNHIPANSTEPLGVQVLKSRGFFPYAYWYWIGVGALFGFVLIFNFGFLLSLTFLKPFDKPHSFTPKDSESKNTRARTRGFTMFLQQGKNGEQINAEGRDSTRKRNPSMSLARRKNADAIVKCSEKRGMILPFEPYSIAFDDITYSVDMPKEMKNQGVLDDKLVLLKQVSGAFRPGVLTALMGVSGAGKTTLLDVLSGRKTSGYITGKIMISGYPKKQKTFARISGYCEQNDIHSPHVTVYESLLYSAWLRLSPEIDAKTRKMFVEEVIELVELNTLKQALVGLPGINGLSTEQRKRLTIAVELVGSPSIIFMDEPTSGLDARAAAIVMRTVRNTVDTGRTVVCTIHQPSIDIFEAFDELLLLKRGGEEIYAGPLGHHSCHMIEYFQKIEGVNKIEDGYNPATWMLEVTTSAQEMALNVDFAAIYKNSELYKKNKELIQELSTPSPGSKDLNFSQHSQSLWRQFIACLWKQHWSYWRNPPYTAVRMLFTMCTALMLGTMFWNVGSKLQKEQDVFNAMGSVYAAVLFIGLQNSGSVQPVVAVERIVFYRERAAGMHSALPYALAQVFIELPYVLMQAFVYTIMVYATIGFEWTAAKFFWFLFFMYFTLLYFTYYGMMTVAISPNQHIAATACVLFYSIWNIFSGFVIPQSRIPVWWKWYTWACPIAWTMYGFLTSQFGDLKSTLETGQTVQEFLRSYFGYKHEMLGVVAAVVPGFGILFAFLFAISIKFFNFQRR